MVNIGLISDTHGWLRPEAVIALQGSDLILHAGDIGGPEILESLRAIAPVIAVRGNVDIDPWAKRLPVSETVEIGGSLIHLRHNLEELDLNPASARIRVVVTGHSHQPKICERQGVLYVNPGSAGPRRFRLPVSLARLEIQGLTAQAKIIRLDAGPR